MSGTSINLDGHSLITPQSILSELSSSGPGTDESMLLAAKEELSSIMGTASKRIEEGIDPAETVKWLIGRLHDLRRGCVPSVWHALIPIVQAHPSAKIFQQDPFTRWSFEKPRGYSGDASLIDFIYGHPDVADEVAKSTTLGLGIYEYTKNAPGPAAVRERRDIFANLVDGLANEKGGGLEILTIAAGHLREAAGSTALKEGRIERWVALDQDPISVDTIGRSFPDTAVGPVKGSVRDILRGKLDMGRFDFIYASGLYDYLIDKVAIKLSRACLDMLKPDGVFVFANFSDEMVDDGYMETYMNWALLLRSEEDMGSIVLQSAEGIPMEARVWFGANRNIVYAEIRRKG